MLTYYTAIILAVIEGLTEFVPVSSTGHMILASAWLGAQSETVHTFEIFIQLGAILAVLVLYPSRFLVLLKLDKTGQGASTMTGLNGIVRFAVACAPAFLFGFLFHGVIKDKLFNPTTVALALIVGGVAFIVIERMKAMRENVLETLTVRDAFIIGLFQCVSLWPGFSRSGATMLGAMLLGYHRRAAAEFSFLIAVPVMFAAVGYDLLKSFRILRPQDFPLFGVGFVISFLVALLAIRFFIGLLGRYTLMPFGVYRILLGLVVLALL